MAGELKLEDQNGNEILDKGVDPVPTLGITIIGSFYRFSENKVGI